MKGFLGQKLVIVLYKLRLFTQTFGRCKDCSFFTTSPTVLSPGVRLSPLGTAATVSPTVPAPDDR
jgi:hypothetical protein